MTDLVTIVSSLGLSGLLSAGLVWISKSWISERLKSAIKHEYDQKLETFKATIKSESDVALEQLRSRLQVAAAERNIRFSRVFERSAETVSETYAKLLALSDAIAAYTSPLQLASDPPPSERRKAVWARYQDSRAYFRPRRIFLKSETADQVEAFHDHLYAVVYKFASDVEGDSEGRRGDLNVWQETADFVATELPKLQRQLERDFRQTLGISDQR